MVPKDFTRLFDIRPSIKILRQWPSPDLKLKTKCWQLLLSEGSCQELWDLDEKTTYFPPELDGMVSFYHLLWLVGGIVGALLALATVGFFRWLKARPK